MALIPSNIINKIRGQNRERERKKKFYEKKKMIFKKKRK